MNALLPSDYDAWYRSPRGAWMAATEARALLRLAALTPGERVLDVGCGTGWFTRRFAAAGAEAVGIDRDHAMLRYAHARSTDPIFVQADMHALPVADKGCDVVIAVTALCFARDPAAALAEMLRVARRTVVLGLLHRESLLYLRKHGRGAYAGAHWHTRPEIMALLARFPAIRDYCIDTRLLWPGGAKIGGVLEHLHPLRRRYGAFLAIKIDP